MSADDDRARTTGRKVCIIGGGPIGIDLAIACLEDGHDVHVFEMGEAVGAAVRSWGHVAVFSENHLNLSPRMRAVLAEAAPADDACPTGDEYVDGVLAPLVARLQAAHGERLVLELGTEVLAVGRATLRKTEAVGAVGDRRRDGAAFQLLVRAQATERYAGPFDVVVDASGTYGEANANRLGPGGLPALGERVCSAALVRRTIPDVHGADRELVAGRRVALIGAGYSAATFLCAVAALPMNAAPRSLLWLTRAATAQPYARIAGDALPRRDALCARANALAAAAEAEAAADGGGGGEADEAARSAAAMGLRHARGATVVALRKGAEAAAGATPCARLEFETAAGGAEAADVDLVVALVGFRPNAELYRELHVHQCYASEGPMKLAATLLAASAGGGGGDCLKQAAPGVATLENPEPNFFIVGSKSYGRNSAFLLRVGFEQVGLLRERLRAA